MPNRQSPASHADFWKTGSGHGRIEERAVIVCETTPIATGFAGSRAIVRIQTGRTRREATLGEDRTRLRHPRALAHLALLRKLTLHVFHREDDPGSLPVKVEHFAAHPSKTLSLILTAL